MKSKFDKSNIFIIALIIFTGIISWNLYFKVYRAKDTVDITLFPKTIGGWESTDIKISENDYAILETRNVVMREYTNPNGRKVYLFIVYSQNNRKVSHPPEVCYTGGGVTILEKTKTTIPVVAQNIVLDVNRLLLESTTEKQVLYYWFKVGSTFTAGYWKQQILIAIKTLLRRPASSALIRVSTDVLADGQSSAIASLQEFSKTITPHLINYLP